MESRELRIGNLIEVNTKEKRIDSLDERGINFYQDSYGETSYDGYFNSGFDLITPIPLTEEWLVKLGFDKKENGYYKDFSGGSMRVDENIIALFIGSEYALNIAMDYDFVELPNEIPKVHQLQNLYFALTGEELTYV